MYQKIGVQPQMHRLTAMSCQKEMTLALRHKIAGEIYTPSRRPALLLWPHRLVICKILSARSREASFKLLCGPSWLQIPGLGHLSEAAAHIVLLSNTSIPHAASHSQLGVILKQNLYGSLCWQTGIQQHSACHAMLYDAKCC